jgi:methylenetetrahydrofolate dehydrogenase (NADP+) / methenyltetrahydrofolate cyclohydrolase
MLNGQEVAFAIQQDIQKEVSTLKRKPCLACVLTTSHPASKTYVARKVKACQEAGIESRVFHLEPATTEELTHFIQTLNADQTIDGILIQLPLPKQIDQLQILQTVHPEKDVDGFHPLNVGKLVLQDPSGFIPCTPLGIKVLLEKSQIPIWGKHVVIAGRSTIVGKPLANLLLQNSPDCNATVTCVHSHTENIEAYTRNADILVAAMGQPQLVKASWIKEGAVVIDVGITRINDPTAKNGTRLVGDVDFHDVRTKCSFITPVPGGVGPMTIAMLLKNTLKSYYKNAS